MPLTLNWQSDEAVACVALLLYATVVLTASVASGSNVQGLRRLLPTAVLWHLIVFVFLSLWVYPLYAVQNALDAYGYHHEAIRLAHAIRAGHFDVCRKMGLNVHAD